ncbi:aminotransferase class V-fold PLP-dependent enzyme [Acidobacteriota bacterium]
MKSFPIRHCPDPSQGVSRRSVLKGIAHTTAAGVFLPSMRWDGLAQSSDILKTSAAKLNQKKLIGDETFWNLVKDQFSIRQGLVMLNAANLCPAPLIVEKKVFELTKDLNADASFTNRAKFSEMKEKARAMLAEFVGADPDEIAIVRNTSEGNNFVINGLTLGKGDEVVIWDQNHPTANVAWDVRAERYGYRVIRVKTPESPKSPKDVINPFIAALTPRTRVLAFSHVSNVSGIRIDAKSLCALARERKILTLVDGAQTFGTYPVDVHDIGCDFFTASSHKWFCGPKEVGILYVRKDRIEGLYPSNVGVGWEGALKNGAQKFDNLGQRDDSRVSAMIEAAEFHKTLRKLRVSSRARMLADAVKNGIRQKLPQAEIITPLEHPMSWGVVIFRIPGIDVSKALETLYFKHNVGCAVMGPNIRFSPHFYNTLEDIEKAVAAVSHLV